MDHVLFLETSLYDHPIGRFHWYLGMTPNFVRMPQLRQSIFYARKGHPQLLKLLHQIRKTVMVWEASGHSQLGTRMVSRSQVRHMESSGELTLELTGPGVFTDLMMPIEEDHHTSGFKSVVIPTWEGFHLVKYRTMGSWRDPWAGSDWRMKRNRRLFYGSAVAIVVLYRLYTRRRSRFKTA